MEKDGFKMAIWSRRRGFVLMSLFVCVKLHLFNLTITLLFLDECMGPAQKRSHLLLTIVNVDKFHFTSLPSATILESVQNIGVKF